MNKIEVGIAAGAIGLIAGLGIGYLVATIKAKKQVKKEVDLAVEDEVAALREEHEKALRVDADILKEVTTMKPQVDLTNDYVNALASVVGKVGYPNLSTYDEVMAALDLKRATGELRPEDEYPEEDEAPIDILDEPEDEEEEVLAIEEIFWEEYNSLPDDYETIFLQYFIVDGVVIDNDGRIINDPEDYLGSIPETYGAAGVTYIRNDTFKLGIKLEIVDTDYASYVGVE